MLGIVFILVGFGGYVQGVTEVKEKQNVFLIILPSPYFKQSLALQI